MKAFLLAILLLAVAALGRDLPQTAAESPRLSVGGDVKMEASGQGALLRATRTSVVDDASEAMTNRENVVDTTPSPLPERAGPRPRTTGAVPHQQIGVEAVPELHASLHRWSSSLPDVEMHDSIASLPGATGMWLREGTAIAQPQVLLAGREFTHIHPDGSLHTPLPFARAMEAVEKGWAERHPWATQREGWEGLVMLYTPQSEADLEIVFQLIVESYNFVTGQAEVAIDYTLE
jgi:phospholipase/carboxylesterase